MISFQNVKVSVLNTVLLNETSFEIEPAQIIGVYGPNGSGKSTLLKSISGIIEDRKISGENRINNNLIFDHSLSAFERAQNVLYLGSDFQTPFRVTVRELFEMAKESNPSSKVNIAEAAEIFGVYSLLGRPFDQMSDGEKQRVMIVRGVIQSPKWLILDETFSKIDIDQSFLLGRELRAMTLVGGMGIIFASHDLNLVSELADQLWLMKRGSIFRQGPVEAILTPENLQELYPGRLIHVVRSPDNGKKKVIY